MTSDLARFYEDQYGAADGDFVEWRMRCSEEKVRNILDLTRGMRFHRVIDIGSGTGAVIERLAATRFADSYYAVDLSEKAVEIILSREIPGLVEAIQADAAEIPYPDKYFDLAILSHIIEHVPDPARVLCEAARIARYVFVEIPIEDTVILNLTWGLRRLIKGKERADNRYGHIVFFSEKSADKLYRDLGLSKLRSRRYLIKKENALFGKRGFWFLYTYSVYTFARMLGRRLASRLYYCHYAALLSDSAEGDNDGER